MTLTAAELSALLREGEGRRVEFKRGLSSDARIARTLCAFANTRGGVLIVGVEDNGVVRGLPNAPGIVERLERIARTELDPPLEVAPRVIELESCELVTCAVRRSGERPHALTGGPHPGEIVVRVGSSNRAADGPTLRALRLGQGERTELSDLEQRVLAWVEARLSDLRRDGGDPRGDATIAAFAREQNFGLTRVRRAFIALERRGWLVAHGAGAHRRFATP